MPVISVPAKTAARPSMAALFKGPRSICHGRLATTSFDTSPSDVVVTFHIPSSGIWVGLLQIYTELKAESVIYMTELLSCVGLMPYRPYTY